MRIGFMGTPDFARAHLEALVNAGHEVLFVLSRADKPVGRKKILTAPPVKECALSFNIPVYQPESLKDGAIADVLDQYSLNLSLSLLTEEFCRNTSLIIRSTVA